jgi:hypothetical protein
MDKEKKEKNERTNVINRLKEDGNEKKETYFTILPRNMSIHL